MPPRGPVTIEPGSFPLRASARGLRLRRGGCSEILRAEREMDESVKFLEIEPDYTDYLRDESRRVGAAESISFPKTESDVKQHLSAAREAKRGITVQGARTGITAGAVPAGGHILNLSRMNRMLGLRRDPSSDSFLLTLQPGVLLSEIRGVTESTEKMAAALEESAEGLQEFSSRGKYFFTPDPTETTASIGGMVSCNASGARSFFYGPTRDHVARIRAVLADGSVVDLARGQARAQGRRFELPTDSGRVLSGELPAYALPDVKNAAGYFVRDDMDLLDLFIGAEGTLGIVTEIDVRLVPRPAALWGIMTFFPSEEGAVGFVRRIREAALRPMSIEFFDSHALDLLRSQKADNPAFKDLPEIPEEWHTAVYVEYAGPDPDAVEEAVVAMSESMAECGGDPDATWLGDDERELVRLKDFRHAVPEAVNLLIDERRKSEPGITKLGTDLAVPDDALDRVLALYHAGLQEHGLEYVIFGHIGSNHVHVNLIPRSLAEYEQGKRLYTDWARQVVGWGGTVSAEHGIGKLKAALLREMYGEKGIEEMRGLKKVFDPDGVLNAGNLF